MHQCCLAHSDQTGHVKDKYVGESVRLIDDVLEYAVHKKILVVLFCYLLTLKYVLKKMTMPFFFCC